MHALPSPNRARRVRDLLSLGLVAVLLAACGSATPVTPTSRPTDSPTSRHTATPSPTSSAPNALPDAVKAALAKQLGVAPDALDVPFVEKADWPDACLGLPAANEACAQIITPGYGGSVKADGRHYEFRADENGRIVRLIPDAALSARQVLAQQQRVDAKTIAIISVEKVDWPDGCLGVSIEGLMCIQVITPGYRVVLEVEGRRYEYHTDESGNNVMLAAAPEPEIEEIAVVWTQPAPVCQTAIIGKQLVAFGACQGALATGPLLPEMNRPDELAGFVETYAAFEAGTPAGQVKFTGRGSAVATAAEQRMIAEWARLVQLEASVGRSGASYGLALAWRREGGVAGFCDEIALFVTGQAFASSCKSDPPREVGRGRLTAAQLEQVYAWVDALQAYSLEQTDPASADALTIRLVFSGAGTREATETEKQAIQEFAAQMFAEMSQ